MKKKISTSSYDFIVNNITFSFSNAMSFSQCPYGWKLNYIDRLSKVDNFFSDYGLLIHDLLERFWAGELGLWDLPLEYEKLFEERVVSPIPAMLGRHNIWQGYKDAGLKFFEDLKWNLDEWEIIGNETTIDCEYDGYKLTIRPDLIYKNKESGLVYLVDYKSKKPPLTKKGNVSQAQIKDYKKQLSLYAYFVEKEMGIKIDCLRIIYTRGYYEVDIPYTKEIVQETLDWWSSTIEEIMKNEEFIPCDTKKEHFFCSTLCGVREHCQYWDRPKPQSIPAAPDDYMPPIPF